MRMPIPAAANAGDAAQNPKTDKGDPLAGFQPWIFKLLPLHSRTQTDGAALIWDIAEGRAGMAN